MKRNYIFSLVLVISFASSAFAMDQENNNIISNNNDQILENNVNQENIIQQHVEVNTVFTNLGENTVNIACKIFRKVQKNTGYLSVASETTGERQSRLNNFGLIFNLKDLSEDAKKGGIMSTSPSLFKQVNDRVHENNRQAQLTLIDMYDKKSLDVGQLNLSKQYTDNSKAYSEALYTVLDNAYNEKFTEIQKSINPKNNTASTIVENNKEDKEVK